MTHCLCWQRLLTLWVSDCWASRCTPNAQQQVRTNSTRLLVVVQSRFRRSNCWASKRAVNLFRGRDDKICAHRTAAGVQRIHAAQARTAGSEQVLMVVLQERTSTFFR